MLKTIVKGNVDQGQLVLALIDCYRETLVASYGREAIERGLSSQQIEQIDAAVIRWRERFFPGVVVEIRQEE